MRQDAGRLLSILCNQDFTYHEFSGRFSDLELWPLFRDLIDDPRLSGLRAGSTVLAPAASGRVDAFPGGHDARAILGQLAKMAAAGAL